MIGRQKIVLSMKSEDLKYPSNLISAFNYAYSIHETNAVDISRLINYRNGTQPVLSKAKAIRPEINNKLVVNHAQMITRNIVGYFLGTPIQYVQSTSKGKRDIDKLNNMLSYEDKASNDMDIGNYQSICGTAYRIIYSDDTDAVPFEDRALDPRRTFVAYQNTISDKPLFGCYYTKDISVDGSESYTLYIYTDFGVYTTHTQSLVLVEDETVFDFAPYSIGGVPIIEYPNNIWRIGDWELATELMDAINSLQSGRLDDIDQIVQNLIIFINADIDSDEYEKMRQAGIVALKNITNNPTDVKQLSNPLDQTGMNMFAKELEELLYAIIGIPDRNNRAGGGADTGLAVELRDGWADLEVVARNKQKSFEKSEKMALKIILTILRNKNLVKITPLDVTIKFSRNKNNNLLVKTQSLQTLLATKILAPEDCLTIVDLVSDVPEYINRGQAFWKENFANNIIQEPITDEKPVKSSDKVADNNK